jgi:hypothetical protein
MDSFYNSELQEVSFSLFNDQPLDTSFVDIDPAYQYEGGYIIEEIPLVVGLPNVIGMNKDEAKTLLESQGWEFYTGYEAYPDGLFSGQGDNPGPSTGNNTVSAVYEFSPYRSLPVGTENTGQQIIIYYWI